MGAGRHGWVYLTMVSDEQGRKMKLAASCCSSSRPTKMSERIVRLVQRVRDGAGSSDGVLGDELGHSQVDAG